MQKLGQGGFGAVYRAIDEVFCRPVALKTYHSVASGSDGSWDEQFLREARALVRIDHPNVVHVLDATIVDGIPVIVMELLEGASLRNTLDSVRTDRPVGFPVAILEQIAAGLGHLHSSGLVHADVKPDNVIVAEEGRRAILVDLGLSRDLLATQSEGSVSGTPRYMAPEVWAGSGASYASDVYALAVIAYELYAGQPPFCGTLDEIRDGHLVRAPRPIHDFDPTIPARIAEIICQGLDKDPTRRPTDVLEFATAIATASRTANYGPFRLVAMTIDNPLQAELDGAPVCSEVYFCPPCSSYFVLLAVRMRDPVPARFTVVERPRSDETGEIPVFCPLCRRSYAHYGSVALL